MHVLFVTTEWPRFKGDIVGSHVVNQVNHLKQAGLSVDVFSFHGHKNPFAYWRASRDFRKIDLDQYDLIHAHHGQSGVVALAQNQCPVVVTFHGSDLQGIRDRRGRVTLLGYVLRFSSRRVASRASAVILVASHLARFLPAHIPYQVIPAGIDLKLFRPIPMAQARAALGLPSGDRLVLFVGDPERLEKRYWLAQKAVGSLPGELGARLVLANHIPPEQMPLYMNACDALVLTSSSEGSPTVVKESLACNLPVVSTDVGDIRQRIGSIDGCQVCADDQLATLASALQGVLESRARILGRATVLDLDEDVLIRKVMQIYKKLVIIGS